MEFFVRLNKSLVLLAFVGGLVLGGGSAKADFTFGPPTNLDPNVQSSYEEAGPSLSADGLSLFFFSNRPGGYGGYDLWVTTRATTQDPWGPPLNLGPTINSSAHETEPSISTDSLSLYFADGMWFESIPRPGGFGQSDIWVVSRATTSGPWDAPVNLGPPVNTGANEGGPAITGDGLTLVFDSDRGGGSGRHDLWVTTRATVSQPWATPTNLGQTVNSSSVDAEPSISVDGLALFFMSYRTGDYDIWATTRPSISDHFATPVNLGSPVNSSAIDATPGIAPNGLILLFMSERATSHMAGDLWQVSITPFIDFHRDGRVDFKDFAYLALFWLQEQTYLDIAPAPFGDDMVDFKDLRVFAENWLIGTRKASNPHPYDRARNVDINADLSWTAGVDATSHDVYFGTTNPPSFIRNQTATTYDPGTLAENTGHYWRIDEVGAYGTTTGTVWRFTSGFGWPPT